MGLGHQPSPQIFNPHLSCLKNMVCVWGEDTEFVLWSNSDWSNLRPNPKEESHIHHCLDEQKPKLDGSENESRTNYN